MDIIKKRTLKTFSIVLVMVLVTAVCCVAYADDESASLNSYGDAVCKSYCWGVKNSDHKIAHNTLIKGTGSTTTAAKKNHNSKMKKHKDGMPSHSHNGQYF